MDAAEYKHLVLGMIFLKYISDTFIEQQKKVLEMVSNPESEYYLGDDPKDHQEALEDRDYYKQELNIELPTTIFEENWWNKGLNYFKDLYESFGFVQVDSPQKHDIIVFKMLAQVSNHCGIYLGEDIFLHHAVNRLSCRESVNSVWRKYIAGYYRCKQFI